MLGKKEKEEVTPPKKKMSEKQAQEILKNIGLMQPPAHSMPIPPKLYEVTRASIRKGATGMILEENSYTLRAPDLEEIKLMLEWMT